MSNTGLVALFFWFAFLIYALFRVNDKTSKAAVEKAYPTINIYDSARRWYDLNMDSSRKAFRKLDMENTYRYLGRAEGYLEVLDLYLKKDSLDIEHKYSQTLNQ